MTTSTVLALVAALHGFAYGPLETVEDNTNDGDTIVYKTNYIKKTPKGVKFITEKGIILELDWWVTNVYHVL